MIFTASQWGSWNTNIIKTKLGSLIMALSQLTRLNLIRRPRRNIKRDTNNFFIINQQLHLHNFHTKHLKSLRHVSILSNYHQGALLFLAKVISQYSQLNSFLQTRCCGSMSCCVGMCCGANSWLANCVGMCCGAYSWLANCVGMCCGAYSWLANCSLYITFLSRCASYAT